MFLSRRKYSFGASSELVWMSHIMIGLLLIYIGYNNLTHRPVPITLNLLLIVLGSLATLYHAHLWYLNNSTTSEL